MAKSKTDQPVVAPKNEFDLSKLIGSLGEGWSSDDFVETGGLTPLYIPEFALEEKWPPVVGRILCFETLKEQKRPNNQVWTPLCIRVIVEAPTFAVMGTKEAREKKPIAKGETILVPIGGNLKTNTRLLAAALDGARIHKVAMYVETTVALDGGRNDMWKWKVMQSNVTEPRSTKGEWMLPPITDVVASLLGLSGVQQLPNGDTYDPKTGEITTNAA